MINGDSNEIRLNFMNCDIIATGLWLEKDTAPRKADGECLAIGCFRIYGFSEIV